ncbi:MAG: triosephosphate isomerase [Chloroflexota bacterium]|nr:triosephosphate isomerase [Chloroflexota bacterium]
MIQPMRPVIVAGNWKMHTTPAEAGDLARTISARTRVDGVTRVLCPPFVCLAAVGAAVSSADVAAPDGTGVAVGAQDVHHELAGAYTGSTSAAMLAGLATWTIVGHSERRRDDCETDERIGRKLLAARSNGLHVILCVGEQLADRDAGRAVSVVERQVRGGLAEADPSALAADPEGPRLTIAYEPVWAIGTGRNARGADAAEMAGAIRTALASLGFANAGEDIPILYGGSVTSSNIDEFMTEPSIDGALVGGASLKPDEMAGIVARAGLTAQGRAASQRA